CAKVTCNVATGQCDEGNVPDLTPCDDQDACTAFDRCMDGACEGGQPVHCSDANQCTADGCSPMSGCTHEPLSGVSCTDGDPCTDGDLCQAGECMTGPALSCNDDNSCTDDACSPGIGCKHVANKLPCDDGNVCTLDDICSAGWCISKTLLKCNDGNPCTDEACDPIVGCISTVNTKPCSDGNACTTGDTCKDGVCQPGAGLPCDDGNLCTTDKCVDPILGTCTHEEKDCKDFDCCTYDYCDPTTGECDHPPCDCHDGDPCTVDIQLGCPDNGTPIQCKHEPKKCDDGNSCTDDWCDPNSGKCENSAKDCDDKNGCTLDSCDPKTGCTHKEKVCDDKNPCTEDSCNWLTGACVVTPKVCDDGNVCTLDSCGLPSGDCVFVALCDDGNICTDDFCAPETGTCKHSAHDCNDGNVCTDDGCEPAGDKGCTHEPAVGLCDDGDPCTDGDACADGQCKPGSPTTKCDDGNACTDDSCDPDSGCLHTPNTAPCDDGNPCNGQDTCGGGVCLPGTGPSCDDADPCTDDGCQGGVCKHTANLAAQGCSEWVFTPSVSCLTGYAPAPLWAIGTATPCDQGDAYNNDRIVGVNSLTGTQVSMFTIASPASQPAYRQQRITLSLDWNWNSTCGGCQIGYNLPGGGIAWQGGQGPHPRGGISMSADGTMYSSYGSILAIGWGGNTVWSAPGNSGGQGTGSWIMGDGGIIGCANGGTCRKVSSGGASQWQQGLGCNGPQLATDSLGRVVASCWDAGVRVYPSGGGNPVWTVDPTPSVSAALVASEDRVVVGTSEGHVLVLSASGATLGDHALCGAAQFTPWMISSNGRVWGLCGNAKVVAVGLDGSNHYTLATGKNANWVALAKDGVPLVSVGASVYRLKKAAETLAAAPWPTVDHDLQRTRNGKQ
ncbi:MAG: hypothetical protein FJ109_18125, partial [Deltaproteobacteria bacterium]|nr:hypothetical protein [Deltaproteobacteria bacterium]